MTFYERLRAVERIMRHSFWEGFVIGMICWTALACTIGLILFY
jgi:hypothetical protein